MPDAEAFENWQVLLTTSQPRKTPLKVLQETHVELDFRSIERTDSGLRRPAGGLAGSGKYQPPAASRMYPVSLFLSSLMPTDLMHQKEANGMR
jgi:hypothetical protein